jgi:acetyl/propionyl-CoA carboxylase alpha subunit
MNNLVVIVGGKSFEIELENLSFPDQEVTVLVDGERLKVHFPESRLNGADSDWLIIDNRSYEILLDPDYRWIKTDRGFYSLEIRDRQIKASFPRSADGRLKAPIPGLVTQVMVAVGDPVEAGQPLLVLEAMKMENEIRALRAGRVKAVNVIPGQVVKLNDILVETD